MRQVALDKQGLARLRLRAGSIFVCSASFEERCLSAPLTIDPTGLRGVIVFRNEDVSQKGIRNCEKICEHFGELADHVIISKEDPIKTANTISKVFHLHRVTSSGGIYVDITCFTREALLILLRILSYRVADASRITLLYNIAGSYGGVGVPTKSRWLSRGVSSIRPVIGYAGNFLSTKPVHLVVLTGYEIDRLSTLFDSIVPSKLTVLRSENTLNEAKASADFRSDVLLSARRLYGNATELVFDPFSIENIFSHLEDIRTNDEDDYLMCVAPLSTKISTTSVGLYCIINEEIQVLYTKPSMYNETRYSTPSDDFIVTTFTIKEIEKRLTPFAETAT